MPWIDMARSHMRQNQTDRNREYRIEPQLHCIFRKGKRAGTPVITTAWRTVLRPTAFVSTDSQVFVSWGLLDVGGAGRRLWHGAEVGGIPYLRAKLLPIGPTCAGRGARAILWWQDLQGTARCRVEGTSRG